MKRALSALLLAIVIAAGAGLGARSADALVDGPLVPSATSMPSGGTPITIDVPLDGGIEDIEIVTDGLDAPEVSGTLLVVTCSPACPADVGESTNTDVVAIAILVDGLDEITLALGLVCTSDASVIVTADTGNADEQSVEIDCVAPVDGGGLLEGGQVAATATPNLLPCGGGTSLIKAEVVGLLGEILEDAEFRFETTAGLIVQTGPDTAKLTLGANQTTAIVTAKIFDPDPEAEEPKTAQVSVSLECNNAPALVVTASPNVIECTGTTTITASVRDVNGHVVPGRGYHFVTNAGLLQVNPNNANTEEALASLTLKPGDGDATVIVSSGLLHGTIEDIDSNENNFVVDETALVTVKQNCLGTTTGQILINSSAKNVSCGENVFIGLSVVDENIQTVIDGTPITLIASHGGFFGGVAEGGQTTLPAAQVPTSHGEANTIYTAPTDYNGEVRITAASGDTYGVHKLNISGCGVTAPAAATPGAAPCVPIGDGVCIAPPNTGRNQITPPSTGSAGLR